MVGKARQKCQEFVSKGPLRIGDLVLVQFDSWSFTGIVDRLLKNNEVRIRFHDGDVRVVDREAVSKIPPTEKALRPNTRVLAYVCSEDAGQWETGVIRKVFPDDIYLVHLDHADVEDFINGARLKPLMEVSEPLMKLFTPNQPVIVDCSTITSLHRLGLSGRQRGSIIGIGKHSPESESNRYRVKFETGDEFWIDEQHIAPSAVQMRKQ